MVAVAKSTYSGAQSPASVLPRRRCAKVSIGVGLVKGWLVMDGVLFPVQHKPVHLDP
jgi:hypothetical protein